jgi:hypothetical protein
MNGVSLGLDFHAYDLKLKEHPENLRINEKLFHGILLIYFFLSFFKRLIIAYDVSSLVL